MAKIQVLSLACPECELAMENVRNAVSEIGTDAEIELVEDPGTIRQLGIYVTPAIAVDGEVRTAGRVPTVAEVRALLSS